MNAIQELDWSRDDRISPKHCFGTSQPRVMNQLWNVKGENFKSEIKQNMKKRSTASEQACLGQGFTQGISKEKLQV